MLGDEVSGENPDFDVAVLGNEAEMVSIFRWRVILVGGRPGIASY